MAEQKKQSFLQGAAVLAIAVAFVKVIGAVFKIPLANLLSEEGFGHFNVAYTVYNVLLVISTAGLPVAVSKMVAESRAKNENGEISRIIKAAMSTFLVVGLVGSIAMFIFAEQIAGMMKSPDSVYTIRVIAPASFFVALMSVFRGYFQGLTNMYPTGISQVIEAASKLVFGLILTWLLLEWGYNQEVAAAGAIGGVTIGTVLGALFMVLRYAFDRARRTEKYPQFDIDSHNKAVAKNFRRFSSSSSHNATSTPNFIGRIPDRQGSMTKRLLRIAIPITIGSGVLALTNFLDSTLVLRRLQSAAGFSYGDAMFLYGSYSYAQTLFSFPSAFIVPFSVSLVPAIASALARGDEHGASRTVETGMRVTSLLALPSAIGLSVLSGPILNLIFSTKPDGAAAATIPLSILAIAVFFNCVVMLSNSTLQAMGRADIPLLTMFAGCVVKIAVNWFLVGNPNININGAPIGTCLCYLTIMVLNLIFIARNIKPAPNILRMFGRPFIASAFMGASAWAMNGLLCRIMSPKLAVLGAIAVAAIVYLVLAILLKAIQRSDLEMLPKGAKIADLLRLK